MKSKDSFGPHLELHRGGLRINEYLILLNRRERGGVRPMVNNTVWSGHWYCRGAEMERRGDISCRFHRWLFSLFSKKYRKTDGF